MDADPVEIRVLGCLIEKQRTTPDQYPLSVNALRNACNQSTSREPVVDWDEATVREGIQRLSHRGWIRLASGPGSRAAKYRHLLDSELSLDGAELAVLAVLMLRGPQTAPRWLSARSGCTRSGRARSTKRSSGSPAASSSPAGRRGRVSAASGTSICSATATATRRREPARPARFDLSPSLEQRVAAIEAERRADPRATRRAVGLDG